MSDESTHVLDLQWTGFFSRGSCTGCDWGMRGHAEDIERTWQRYHENGVPLPIPPRLTIPPLADDPYCDLLERRIIILLTHRVDFNRPEALYVALGLAEARAFHLLQKSDDPGDPRDYVSTMMGRIAVLSKHQREKLRHPTRTRQEQQELLEGK